VFHHAESVPYAFQLLNGTELFGQKLRLQNKATGIGGYLGYLQGAGTKNEILYKFTVTCNSLWWSRSRSFWSEPDLEPTPAPASD